MLRQAGGDLVGIQRQRRRRQLCQLAGDFRQALLHDVLLPGIARLLLDDGPPARQRVSPLALAIAFVKPQVEGVMGILQAGHLPAGGKADPGAQPQPVL